MATSEWIVVFSLGDDMIPSAYADDKFAMYGVCFKEIGLHLPFTELLIMVFHHLHLEPSQLHPNSIVFLRDLELVWEHLGIGASLPLFFSCFHLERGVAVGWYSWVSLKQPKKISRFFLNLFGALKTGFI